MVNQNEQSELIGPPPPPRFVQPAFPTPTGISPCLMPLTSITAFPKNVKTSLLTTSYFHLQRIVTEPTPRVSFFLARKVSIMRLPQTIWFIYIDKIQSCSIRVRYFLSPDSFIYQILNFSTSKINRCRPADISPVHDQLAARHAVLETKLAESHRNAAQSPHRLPLASFPSLLLPVLTVAHLEIYASSSTLHQDPKHLTADLQLPCGADRPKSMMTALTKTSNLVPGNLFKPPTSTLRIFLPNMWRCRYKPKSDGTLVKRFARCTARGDLMKTGLHYDADKTASQTP